MDPIVLIDVDRCVGCFMCERACALAQCLTVDENEKLVKIVRPWDCTGCGACERACPYHCIIVISDPDEVSKRAKITTSRVTRYMSKPVTFCSGTERINEIAKIMILKSIGSLIFYRNNLLHIITETDILKLYLNDAKDISTFNNTALTISEKETITNAIKIMLSKKIGHLPVTSFNEKVIGMLSIRDCLRGIAVTEVINPYITIKKNESLRSIVSHFKHINISEKTTLSEAISIMLKENVKALIVENERVGIFTIRDAIKMISDNADKYDIIRPRYLEALTIDSKVSDAIIYMIKHNTRHVLIKDQNSYFILPIKEVIRDSIWIEKHVIA
ncbi:CBS domain-containing protein [Acidianus sulfidivorans JP7]|uniref:Signal transduction protein n=1 Tax=Acidianus sulfidivorans JP7 TaxID=619593 RepID=A0A2U9ILH1_9CREN|nr:CBS domain-containing protein [Acidianus sulfidivorans]AWR96898.1 CBS domain-containing protein [Acidianus sulfidivorans JP7]